MTDVLDVVGLLALVAAGFLVTLWLGFLAIAVGCLAVSRSVTRRKRLAAEAVLAEQTRRVAMAAR